MADVKADELQLLEFIESALLEEPTFDAQVILDLDEDFNLIDIEGNSNPAVFLECDLTVPTDQEHRLGTIIIGNTSMTVTGIVAKENRAFKTYMREAVDLRNLIITVFQNKGRRIKIKNCAWNPMYVKGCKALGFIMDIDLMTDGSL